MKLFIACLVAVGSFTVLAGAADRQSTDHVTVHYNGITAEQAQSLARVADAARAATVARFGFDVPDRITVNVDCKPTNKVRLFTNGNDTYTLSIRTPADLAPPSESGINNLYGMCHELGHVVMYRVIKNHDWLTNDAAEAWAHYFGSQIVDDVYAAAGEKVWWTPYDYRADGMSRLRAQIEEGKSDEARAWMELTTIVGEKNMPALFAAWEKAGIDPTNPSPTVLAALKSVCADANIDAWWKKSQPMLIATRPLSNFAAAPATKPAAPGKPTELALDDGKSAGKKSIAGSGHAVGFEAPAEGCRVISVKIFGSRYGAQQPPADDFHVFLCDSDGKQIKDIPFPYKSFLRGGDRWVVLKLPEPADVPKIFIVCVAFNPTASKGVFVHYDAKPDGDSRTGLPGELNDAFDKGDWMIRAIIETPGQKN